VSAGQGGALYADVWSMRPASSLSLLASAIYHLCPLTARALLGRIDHAAIYFKIAGHLNPLRRVDWDGVFAYGNSFRGRLGACHISGRIRQNVRSESTESKASLYLYLAGVACLCWLVWRWWQSPAPMALNVDWRWRLIYSLGNCDFCHTPGMRFQNAYLAQLLC